MDSLIYFAPLQSYTTIPYYQSFHKLIGGVDKYFTPFYRSNKGAFPFEKQLVSESSFPLIPQVLTNNSSELMFFAKSMQDRGFDEININLGCPFPMVANRRLGSGLMPCIDEVRELLFDFFTKDLSIKLSVKCRLGWSSKLEIGEMLKVFNEFPIHEIIVHPRLGIQRYKGEPDWISFKEVVDKSKVSIVGNGDISTLNELEVKNECFPTVNKWMIGRGLLTNPFMLKKENLDAKEKKGKMELLHDLFYDNLVEYKYSDEQMITPLKCFWEYPLIGIDGGSRVYKKLRKIGKLKDYHKWYTKEIEENNWEF